MKQRNVHSAVLSALQDSPVVFLNGPRQAGKTTFVQSLIEQGFAAQYVTLDDIGALSSAQRDPQGFINSLQQSVVIDEVQRVPELFLAIKKEVDRKRSPGRFLLTGSANVLLLPHLADSLAGRMHILTLYPFSQGEIEDRKEGFIDRLFSSSMNFSSVKRASSRTIEDRVTLGGYPELLTRLNEKKMQTWLGSYVTTIVQRDIRDLSKIEGITQIPQLLSLLAARTAQLLNLTNLSNSFALPQSTLKRYLALLETTYLIHLLPAWSSNIGKRFIKTPKLFFCDTGVLSYLLGLSSDQMAQQHVLFGHILENFIMMELTKQQSWSATETRLFHFRTLRGQEVDFILEDRKRKIIGIEVKAGSTVQNSDFKNLHVLSELSSKHFYRGIVLYTGSDVLPFGKNMFAVPIENLWE